MGSAALAATDMWIGSSTHGVHGKPSLAVRRLRAGEDELVLGRENQVGESPMYLAWWARQGLLLAAHETDDARLTVWRPEADALHQVGGNVALGSHGACHVAVTDTGLAATANYTGSSFSMLRVTSEGASQPVALVRHEGTGPDVERQEASHPHHVQFHTGRGELLVTDLGTDRIHRYRFDEADRPEALHPIELPPGSGPRHLTVLGDRAVVACELDGTLRVIDLASDTPALLGWAEATGVASFRGDARCSAITATRSGVVIVANRGPDTVASFRFDQSRESLEFVDEAPTGGVHPRDFELTADERHLIVANQASDSLTVLQVGPAGHLTLTPLRASTASPTCLVRVS